MLFDEDGQDVCLWFTSGWIVRSKSSPQFNLPLIKAGALGSLKDDSVIPSPDNLVSKVRAVVEIERGVSTRKW